MTGPLLYNPIRAGRDELEAMLVARRDVVDKLISDLVVDSRKKTRRHWQLIGPRGSGKSHLTQLVALRLSTDHGWAVARLPEEHYQISSVGDLLEQIVMRLEDRDVSPLADISAADLEERALDRIRTFASSSGKPILVVVENLAILFERQLRTRRDQQRLRQILSKSPPFALVATATSYVSATVEHAAPFYDFFQIVDLDDLTRDEVVALIEARVNWDRDPALVGALERVRARVRAMYHFSGGNPRLVLALYAILRAGVTDELYEGLLKLLDEVTPYYQARLSDVAPQAGRVLTELALGGSEQTAADLARRCRLPTNQITTHIAKLEAERFVRPIARGKDRRRRHYDLTDRLFRLWIQMREDRTTRQRLRFLIEFYQQWYEGVPAELEDDALAVAQRFWTGLDAGALAQCRAALRTLDHLREAVPAHRGFVESESLRATRGAPPQAIAHARLDALAPLRNDPSPYTAAVATLLSIDALHASERLGDAVAMTRSMSLGIEAGIASKAAEGILRAALDANAVDAFGELQTFSSARSLLTLLEVSARRNDPTSMRALLLDTEAGLDPYERHANLVVGLIFVDCLPHLAILSEVADVTDEERAILRLLSMARDRSPGAMIAALHSLTPGVQLPRWMPIALWLGAVMSGRRHEVTRLLAMWEDGPADWLEALFDAINAGADGEAAIEVIVPALGAFAAARVRTAFVELTTERGQRANRRRGSFVTAYEYLRDAALLPAEFEPYSTAAALRLNAALASTLAPELREAVELLLTVDTAKPPPAPVPTPPI